MSRISSCLFVALANLWQHKTRLFVALLGTGVPIVLLFFQFASLEAARIQVTRLYDFFDFDLALVPTKYQFLAEGGTFDRARFTQALAVDGVAAAFSLNVDANNWQEDTTERRSTLLLIGLDDPGDFVRDASLRQAMGVLTNSRSVLVDDFSSVDFGTLATGTAATISDNPVEIAGHFQLGLFFYADGSAIVRNADFPRLATRDARLTNVGLLRLGKGADPAKVKAELAQTLPPDVRVVTRDEFIGAERAFFISTKPLGIMVVINMWIAFIAGSIILLQVVAADVINRIREFATMKAMGFGPSFVLGVGVLEAALLAVGSFLPALGVSAALLWAVQKTTHLPTAATAPLIATVFTMALLMCLLSAIVALRRIARAAPAELYR